MQIQKAWLSAIPLMFLAAACDQSRAITDVGSRDAELAPNMSTTAACQAQIDALSGLTGDAPITGKNAEKDENGLVNKLTQASSALSLGKNADAAQKLTDFTIKVGQLRDAGKLDLASAEQLISDANDAISCIENIGA